MDVKKADAIIVNSDLDSLIKKSAKTIISSISEDTKSVLLQELIDEKSDEDKLILYQMLGDVLHGGTKLSDKYVYGIFSICDAEKFIEEGSHILGIYQYLDRQNWGQNFQIMFIQSSTPDYIVRFDCARASRKKNLPPGDHPADYYDSEDADDRALFDAGDPVNLYYYSLIEHSEARLLHDILKTRKTKDGFDVTASSIVVRFRDGLFKDDGDHILIGEEWGPGLGLCVGKSIGHGIRHDMNLFSDAIEDSEHCDTLEANHWETELEFSITMKGEKCNVLLRIFECPAPRHYRYNW